MTFDETEFFVLFVLGYGEAEDDPITLCRHYKEVCPRKVLIEELVKACQHLQTLGYLRTCHRYAKPDHTIYGIAQCLNCELLLAILKQSVEHRWWKVFDADSVTCIPGTTGYYSSGGYTLKDHRTEAVLRRTLVDATGSKVDFQSLYDPESEYWLAAQYLTYRLSPNCVWQLPPVPFSKTNPLSLHLKLLAVLFVEGREIRPMVTALGTMVSEGRLELSEADLCELVALSVLTGVKVDFAPARNWDMQDSAKSFLALADTLRAGDLAAANKLCSNAFKEIRNLEGLTAPAFNLLAALVNLFFRPSATRINQHLRTLCPHSSYRYYSHSHGERHIIDRRSTQLNTIAEFLANIRLKNRTWDNSRFMDNLGEVIWALANGIRKEEAVQESEILLLSALKAMNCGYPTLAAVYLSAFGWALPANRRPEAEALSDRLTCAGGIWLRPFEAAPTEWKRILSALDERLPKVSAIRQTAAKVRSGRIIWMLSIVSSSTGNCFCERIAASFRGPRAAEDGSGDKPVTMKSVYGGKYDDCLTESDRVAVAALNKIGYNGSRGQIPTPIPPAVLEALCGQDNLMQLDEEYEDHPQPPVAMELERQDIPVVGKTGENGVMRLSVPEWCLTLRRNYVLRQNGDHSYAYYPIDKNVRSVIEVFRDFGDDGAIDFPKEALESMRPVLGRLASVLPLQGALSKVSGECGMTRIEGEAIPLVRLSLEEMRLHISLKTRPIKSATGVLFEPGVGQAERTLKLAKGPVILVRDLQREKQAAAVVEQALAAFEGDRDESGEWQLDEAASALTALAAIHALGKAAQVEWLPGKKVYVSRPVAHPKLEASMGADEWFAVSGNWQLDDGRLISLVKLLENFDNRIGRFVPIDEKGYLELSRELLRQLDALKAAGQLRRDKIAVSPAALPMLDGAFAADDREGLQLPQAMSVAAERIREVFAKLPTTPAAFKGTMRPYQEEGYQWLSRLCDCHIGACLADDMGLGKTIQLIALLVAKKSEGASLVVAPASVAFNWRNELNRFAPSLRVAMVGQTSMSGSEDVTALIKTTDVIVTSYGVVTSRLADFVPIKWNVVVLDEAQAIKNHLTQRAKGVKELQARFRVAATGTPVENRLTELWSIFDFLNPGMLGGESHFTRELAPHGEATPRLKRLVKPLILRRIKREVLTDLPEKEEITIPVVLGEEERHAYEATRINALNKLNAEDPSNKIAILAELTRLRRFCCHPSLVLPDLQASAKLEALERLLTGLKENGHRALVFSQFVDYLTIVRERLAQKGWTHEYLDGATSKTERERAVERFQNGSGDFFLISLKAGGMGLNLTAANYVILLDPWWNPAVENQAADRVHRIGQRLPVTVYRLITQNTIEEKVVNLHAKKTALAEDILASGAAALSAEDMLGLLSE